MITVGNCGYDSNHPVELDRLILNGYKDYTLLFIKTDVWFDIEGEIKDYPPNTVILYDKNTTVHYGCRHPHYNDDWIHFDLDPEDLNFLKSLNIPFNTPIPLTQIGQLSDYIRLIVLAKVANSSYAPQIIDSTMHSLLYCLASHIDYNPEDISNYKYYTELTQLRMEIMNAPHQPWNVELMADKVHLSPSYFQHLYKSFFDISCMQDVILARIKNAKFYLQTTNISIHSLAELCGYDNELHFMKQFKKHTNMTPLQYRKSFLSAHRIIDKQ